MASSRPSCLVAHPFFFKLVMKGQFDAYVLWSLAQRIQNWTVDQSTAREFTVVCNSATERKHMACKQFKYFHDRVSRGKSLTHKPLHRMYCYYVEPQQPRPYESTYHYGRNWQSLSKKYCRPGYIQYLKFFVWSLPKFNWTTFVTIKQA